MKKGKIYPLVLASAVLLLVLIIFPSTELISDAHSSSQRVTYAYVANIQRNTVYVIDTATNIVITEVSVGRCPSRVAVTPDGTKVYVIDNNGVSVIDTATNTVTTTVNVGNSPAGIAVTPDGTKVYVSSYGTDSPIFFVIDTATDKVTATIPIKFDTFGVAITPDGKKVYALRSVGVDDLNNIYN